VRGRGVREVGLLERIEHTGAAIDRVADTVTGDSNRREVVFAINFNDETVLMDDKVGDIRPNWGLFAHVNTVESPKLSQF
jgi:hypothetical protein